MCKLGKSLLRWLTFKRAHQSPGHLTHSLTELMESISTGWESPCIKFCLQMMMSMSDLFCLFPGLATSHNTPCLEFGLREKCVMMCCLSSHVVQLCAGCDWILAACQYPLLVVWNYCKRKEAPWWLRALVSTHDWDWGPPPLMIITGHNLSPIEKLFWTSIFNQNGKGEWTRRSILGSVCPAK